MSLTIVLYAPHHHQAIVSLVTTIQQNEFELPITYEDQPDLADITSFFDIFLVAVFQDQVVGTIGAKITNDYAILRKMFVKQEFRGSTYGVAQKLLEELETLLVARAIQKIYLGTTAFFKAAHKFYAKNGYQEIDVDVLPRDFPIMKIDTKFYSKEIL